MKYPIHNIASNSRAGTENDRMAEPLDQIPDIVLML